MTTTASIATGTPAAPVRSWLPGLLGLGMIWGSSFLFIKVGVLALPPAYVSLGRVASGTMVLAVLLVASGGRLPRDRAWWLHNAFVGIVGIAAPFTLFAYGETRISSILAGIWNATTPLIVLPMAVLVFRTERFTRGRVLGLLLGLVGALVLLGVWRGVGGASLSGQLLCLAAAACYGVQIPYTKRFLAGRPESGVAVSVTQLLAGSVALAVAAPVLSGGGFDPAALTWPVVLAVLTLGVVGTGIAFVINVHNIRLVGATTASMVTYIVPVFATLLGLLVLGERLEWFQPVGALIVLLGVAVAQFRIGDRSAVVPDPGGAIAVKETEFWARLEGQLGRGYAQVWAAEHRIAALNGQTAAESLRGGRTAKEVWRAVWRELELPDRDR